MGRTAASRASKEPPPAADTSVAPDPKQALRELDQAIELIPPEEKGAYLRAVQTVPELVQLESPPLRYLRFDAYNTWAAARRLVDYWEGRVELFGADRAFLPLRLTPVAPPENTSSTGTTFQSALDELDVQVVNSGVFMILPKDSHGRPVMLHDRSRLPNQPEAMDSSRRLRCNFYMLHVLAELLDTSEDSSFEAAYITVFGNKTRRASIDFQMVMKGVSLFGTKQILPFRIASWHVVLLGTRNFVLQRVIPFIVQTCEALVPASKPTTFRIHQLDDEKDVEKIQEELQEAGFGLEGLPKVGLDGLWTIGCFKCWIDTRMRTERRMYSGSQEECVPTSGSAAASTADHDEDDAFEEQQSKRRQLEAAYARRKRARRKINFKVLQEELRRHQAQKQQLLQTNQKLERLLEEAESVVRFHLTESDKVLPRQPPSSQGHGSDGSVVGRVADTARFSREASNWLQPPILAARRDFDPRGSAAACLAASSTLGGLTSNPRPELTYAQLLDPRASAVSSQVNMGHLFEPSILSPLQQASAGLGQGSVAYPLSHHHLCQQLLGRASSVAPAFSPAPPFRAFDPAPSRTDLLVNAILSSRSEPTVSFPPHALGVGSVLSSQLPLAPTAPSSGLGHSSSNPPNPYGARPRGRFLDYFGL